MPNSDDPSVEENTDNMVLRTVFLPLSLDSELKRAAHEINESKGEVIRRFIQHALRGNVQEILRKPRVAAE